MRKENILKILIITTVATFAVITHNKAIQHQKEIRLQNAMNFKYKTEKQRYDEIYKMWVKPSQDKILAEKRRQEQKKKEESEWIPVRLSFYTNSYSDCDKIDGISSSGKHLNRGGNFIAAPRNIPYGTKLYIEKLGDIYEVQDRGGAIVWKNGIMHLDVYIPNVSQSYLNKLGVKYTKARIIK